MVTFLLITNLAMWTFNALVSNKADSHPMQVENWSFKVILAHIC